MCQFTGALTLCDCDGKTPQLLLTVVLMLMLLLLLQLMCVILIIFLFCFCFSPVHSFYLDYMSLKLNVFTISFIIFISIVYIFMRLLMLNCRVFFSFFFSLSFFNLLRAHVHTLDIYLICDFVIKYYCCFLSMHCTRV